MVYTDLTLPPSTLASNIGQLAKVPSSPSAIADCPLSTLPSGDDMRSQPKRKVWAHILQDQGMLESGGGCATEHCEDPNQVDEIISCAGIGCSNQVSVIILDIVRVKALTSMAVSFDRCANCTGQGKELVLWASMQG